MNLSYEIRDLEVGDLHGLMNLLGHLTAAPDLSTEELVMLFQRRIQAGVHTKVAVVRSSQQVAGTASLIVEPKFTRGGRSVGHIEDVVTHPDHRGKGIGGELLRSLLQTASDVDCYKVILDCREELVEYYGSFGFRKCETQMRYDIA